MNSRISRFACPAALAAAVLIPPAGARAAAAIVLADSPPVAEAPIPPPPKTPPAPQASPAAQAPVPPAKSAPSGEAAPPSKPPAAAASANPPPPATPPKPTGPAVAVVRGAPLVIDSATLLINGTIVHLAGVEGLTGEPAHQLYRYINGRDVTCEPAAAGAPQYHCTVGDYDVGEAVVLNGAGRANAEASPRMRRFEQEAKEKHRGIWAKATAANGE